MKAALLRRWYRIHRELLLLQFVIHERRAQWVPYSVSLLESPEFKALEDTARRIGRLDAKLEKIKC